MEQPLRPVTIRDVARQAGVSIATVSRACHGTAPVADLTRARVESAIAELGYTPSRRRPPVPEPEPPEMSELPIGTAR